MNDLPAPSSAQVSGLDPLSASDTPMRPTRVRWCWEVLLVFALMFVHGGDVVPGINEAHYLVKARGVWEADYCPGDLFVHSGKAHWLFDMTFGALTHLCSLTTAAWIGRVIGWLILSIGLVRLSWRLVPINHASVLIGLLWMVGVDELNLAGEWVVGGIEAKVPAYALMLLGLEQWLGPRPYRAWILLGAAAAFHVLVGGWSVLALGFASLISAVHRRTWRQHCLPLVIGGLISLVGLVPALRLSGMATPELAQRGAEIYTYERISHHLYAPAFAVDWYQRFGLLLVVSAVFIGIAWKQRGIRELAMFALGSLLIALAGLAIGWGSRWAPELAARLLRFYWFRLSDAVVPLIGAIAIVATLVCPRLQALPMSRVEVGLPRWISIRSLGSLAAIVLLCAGAWIEVLRWQERMELIAPGACRQSLLGLRMLETNQQKLAVLRDWQAVCRWISENTAADAVVLTPRYQQTFKWYAGRSEVVNWKDVPQDATSLVEWSNRMKEVFPAHLGGSRVTIRYDRLREFRQRYGARYVIGDRRIVLGNLPLVKVYPLDGEENATFDVYLVPID